MGISMALLDELFCKRNYSMWLVKKLVISLKNVK